MDTNAHESIGGLNVFFIRVYSCPFGIENQ